MVAERLIHRIPLKSLWDDDGDVNASRERLLSKSDLREILQKYPVEFYLADVGHPLQRVDVAMCFEFWKHEVIDHVVEDPSKGFYLDDFPGSYAYVASEWSGCIETPIVLLEKHH
jgi:hypothetical protein